MPTFSLVYSPLLLSVQLLPIYNAPLPLTYDYYYTQWLFLFLTISYAQDKIV